MILRHVLLIALTSFAPLGIKAQTSPSPSTQPPPAPTQVKPAPCVPPKPPNPSQEVQIKPTSRWQKMIEAQRAKIEAKVGITVPDISLNNVAKKAQAPNPCPAAPATTSTPPPASASSGNPTTPPAPDAAPAPTNTPPPTTPN